MNGAEKGRRSALPAREARRSGRLRHRGALVSILAAAALTTAACGGGSSAPAPGGSSKPPSHQASGTKPAAGGSGASSSSGAIPTIPAGHPVSITTAYSVPSAVFTPIWIAHDKGYFKKFGLNVKVERVEGSVQIAGIVSGSIEIGNTGGTEILDSRSKGADVFGVLEGTHYAVFELHGAPKYKTVKDFKGKTIAITKTGSSTDMAARVLLTKYGLKPGKNVHILGTGGMPNILAALQKGVVQGGVMSPPTTLRADKAGFPMVASTLKAKVPLQMNMIVTTGAFAKKDPAAVYAYMKGYLMGLADFFHHPKEAIAEIAKYTHTPTAIAKAAYDAVEPAMVKVPFITNDGLKTVQEYGTNPRIKTLNIAKAHNNTYLQNLVNAGFLKKIGLQ